MDSKPRVSVVMAVYDGLPYLHKAVESVLDQTYSDFEFIMIDDGSVDGSTRVLRHYEEQDERIRLIEQENRGVAPSWNRGVDQARGEYIARMDADDICLPERFEIQVGYMDAHPDCVLLGGEVIMIDEEGQPLSESHPLFAGRSVGDLDFRHEHDALERRLLTGEWAFVHPAVMMRRKAVEKIGGYNSKFKDAEDWDLFLRLAERGNIANLSACVLKYRCHWTQMSTTSPIQNYWGKRARRAGYLRRGLALPEELRLPAMVRSAVGKELRKRGFYQPVVRLFSRFL